MPIFKGLDMKNFLSLFASILMSALIAVWFS